MRARLYRGMLHYHGVTLHTASSGSVAGLDTLWLVLDDESLQGIGEVRLNISYLHGYSQNSVLENVVTVLSNWNWQQSAEQMLDAVHRDECLLLAPGRMLLDCALHDLLAKQAQLSVAQRLNPSPSLSHQIHTNQTLFWGSTEQLLNQAQSYVERGFTQLKLRVGVGAFADDLHRLTLLRETFGDAISLAIDVNGQWQVEQAKEHLASLKSLSLEYVEQPVAVADDKYLSQLAEFGIPLMLDESINSAAAIERIILSPVALCAHLKLVKLGGITPLMRAAKKLKQANVPFMIGQMNEGNVATAAAIAASLAMAPEHAELYGADGLKDDPARGVCYHDGMVSMHDSYGLGVSFDATGATFLKEFNNG